MIGIVPIFTKGRGRCECVVAELVRALRDAERRRPSAQKVAVLSGGERGVGRGPRGRGRDRAENVGRRRDRVEHVRRRLHRVSGARGARRCDTRHAQRRTRPP
jgi:hypothetical protein